MQISGKNANFALVIELERHIEILLLSNDCVIVPGLGGFMTNHVDARYDDSDGMFLPPLRTLGFNPKLTLNDSLLAQSYIEAYDISYPEAIHRIEDQVNELRQHLENQGNYELNDIGTLFLNNEGNIEFNPCEAGILTPSLYALSSFEIERQVTTVPFKTSEIKQQPNRQTDVQPAAIVPATSSPQEENNKVPVSAENDESEEKTARTVSIRVSVLRNLAAAAVVLLAFLLYSNPLSDKSPSTAAIDSSVLLKVMPRNATVGTTTISNEAKSTNSEAESNNKETESSKSEVQDSKTEVQASNAEAQNSEPYYTLVLASHVTKANAAAYADELKKQGFDAQVITRTSTKVIYGKFATQNEAYNKLHQLAGNKPFAEAWVLMIK